MVARRDRGSHYWVVPFSIRMARATARPSGRPGAARQRFATRERIRRGRVLLRTTVLQPRQKTRAIGAWSGSTGSFGESFLARCSLCAHSFTPVPLKRSALVSTSLPWPARDIDRTPAFRLESFADFRPSDWAKVASQVVQFPDRPSALGVEADQLFGLIASKSRSGDGGDHLPVNSFSSHISSLHRTVFRFRSEPRHSSIGRRRKLEPCRQPANLPRPLHAEL